MGLFNNWFKPKIEQPLAAEAMPAKPEAKKESEESSTEKGSKKDSAYAVGRTKGSGSAAL